MNKILFTIALIYSMSTFADSINNLEFKNFELFANSNLDCPEIVTIRRDDFNQPNDPIEFSYFKGVMVFWQGFLPNKTKISEVTLEAESDGLNISLKDGVLTAEFKNGSLINQGHKSKVCVYLDSDYGFEK